MWRALTSNFTRVCESGSPHTANRVGYALPIENGGGGGRKGRLSSGRFPAKFLILVALLSLFALYLFFDPDVQSVSSGVTWLGSVMFGYRGDAYLAPERVIIAQDPFDEVIAVTQTAAPLNATNSNGTTPLPQCPQRPPGLRGPRKVYMDAPPLEKLENLYAKSLSPGGHSRPAECRARHRVAIIVPYRNREQHLAALLHNLHAMLPRQQIDYAIYVVEQIANQTFNRAKLMNVGFVEASKLYAWDCFIFHDVDLLPEDDRNLYSCPSEPRHMSVAVDTFKYQLPYRSIFGGVSALTRRQFKRVNGFSNSYWGWGAEDDDMSARVSLNGFAIARYPLAIARYKMFRHKVDPDNEPSKCRLELLGKVKSRWQSDGLVSLKYQVKSLNLKPLYTHILVDLLEDQSRAELRASGILQNC